MPARLQNTRLLFAALLGLGAALLVEGLWSTGVMDSTEAMVWDRWHEQQGVVEPSPEVVMVWVDGQTLDRLPEPLVLFSRHFATAIERARALGATVIGVDYVFQTSAGDALLPVVPDAPEVRSWDADFYRAVSQGDVVLSAFLEASPEGARVRLPHQTLMTLLRDPRASLGIVNHLVDDDGTVRRYVLQHADTPGAPELSFGGLLALRHRGLDPHEDNWELGGHVVSTRDHPRRIAWSGPPGTMPAVSLHQLIEPGGLTAEEEALFAGHAVIIGSNTFSSDQFSTPYERASGLMAGAEVHANVLQAMLSGRRIEELPLPGRMLLMFLLGALSAVGFFRSRPEVAVLGGLFGSVAWAGVGWLGFSSGAVLLPTVSGFVALGTTFAGAYALRFTREEQDRQALRRVFERYVPHAVVNEVLRQPEAAGLGGRSREITVLFSDIRGFTSLSEQLEPEEVVELLNAWFSRACQPIEEHGGVVDKFIGDAVMAIFGAPIPSEHHAAAALRAGIDMAREAELFVSWVERRFPGKDLPPFSIGIGIHTGRAVVGNVGFERRLEYTAVGDTVNVASRVEGLTRSLGTTLLVTRATLDRSGLDIAQGRTAQLPLRGRAEPVEVVEVHTRRDR